MRQWRPLAAALLFSSMGAQAQQDLDFPSCIASWQTQAQQRGYSEAIVDTIIPGLQFQARVIELDRRQPEFTSSLSGYLSKRVTDKRIDEGRALLETHADLLAKLTREYGVPGRFLVSFWGLETNFGNYLGNMPTLDSLATLACDQRRSGYFTTELMTALGLVEKHGLNPADMRGSWAGAMGHTQFMPSNYARYGVDGDGDGRINLWQSIPDALTSAAHFLSELGWEPEMRWGREVQLPKGFDYRLAGRSRPQSLQAWAELGVMRADGKPLPVVDMDAALIVPAGHRGPAFLIYKNFRVIMRWNNSEFYALSVGLLADRIAGAPGLIHEPSESYDRLSLDSIKALQAKLNTLGFDAGKPDGIPGSGTAKAIREFQISKGLIADGYHSAEVFAALGIDPNPATE